MQKSLFFLNLMFTSIIIAMVFFSYLFMVGNIKVLNKNISRTSESLKEMHNRVEAKLIDIQKLSSEERIVKIASDSLGLIRAVEPFEIITVSPAQIQRIEKILSSKHE